MREDAAKGPKTSGPRVKQRPAGWVAPGPRPRGDLGLSHLMPGPDEDLSFLSGDFRIFQFRKGHRWSLDDYMTALVAIREGRARGGIDHFADLGCGIGSVLMMVAWAFPAARGAGIEAQSLSIGLARRSLEYNGIDDRCELRHGDLRDVTRELPNRPFTPAGVNQEQNSPAPPEEGARSAPPQRALRAGEFELVTGTPPYIPIGSGTMSERKQRGPCFFEVLGGIEDYAVAAARLVGTRGFFVTCAGAQPAGRAERAIAGAGLAIIRRVDVVPRESKPVLFHVFVAQHRDVFGGSTTVETFRVRDAQGDPSEEHVRSREELGLPDMRRSR